MALPVLRPQHYSVIKHKATTASSPGTMILGWQRTACTGRHWKTEGQGTPYAPSCSTEEAQPSPSVPSSLKGTSTCQDRHTFVLDVLSLHMFIFSLFYINVAWLYVYERLTV